MFGCCRGSLLSGWWCVDMLFGRFVVWLVVCGYAVWIACGWSLVAGVSVALISCWQADERAVSPRGGAPGRKPV